MWVADLVGVVALILVFVSSAEVQDGEGGVGGLTSGHSTGSLRFEELGNLPNCVPLILGSTNVISKTSLRILHCLHHSKCLKNDID